MATSWKGLDHGFDIIDVWGTAGVAVAVGVPSIYLILRAFYRSMGWWKGMTTKAGEPIVNMVAFEYAFMFPCFWFVYCGFALYFGWNGVDDLYTEPLKSDTYYGKSDFVIQNLLYPMMWYQIWNVLFTFHIKELFKPDSFIHHFLTALVQYIGFDGFLNYHAFFFLGIVELSSIPLCIVDMTRFDPEFSDRWPKLYHFCKMSFVVCFIVTRNILWPIVAFPCLYDLYQLIATGKAHSNLVVGGFMAATVLISYLQAIWGLKIVRLTRKSFRLEEEKMAAAIKAKSK
jgi:hypothetical protein